MKNYDFAKIAYDAYIQHAGCIHPVTGKFRQEFVNLRQGVQDVWWSVAEAVRNASGIGQPEESQ